MAGWSPEQPSSQGWPAMGPLVRRATAPRPAAPGTLPLMVLSHPRQAALLSPYCRWGRGGSEHGGLWLVSPAACVWPLQLQALPSLAVPDGNEEEQGPREAVEGGVAQEEAGVEAGRPQQVLQRRGDEHRGPEAAGSGSWGHPPLLPAVPQQGFPSKVEGQARGPASLVGLTLEGKVSWGDPSLGQTDLAESAQGIPASRSDTLTRTDPQHVLCTLARAHVVPPPATTPGFPGRPAPSPPPFPRLCSPSTACTPACRPDFPPRSSPG